MFYIHKGDLCVTPVGETVPEYIALKQKLTEGRKTNNLFVDTCNFIFFVYHKEDTLGNKNIFSAYPLFERTSVVIEKYKLFKGKKVEDILAIQEVQKFKDFYIRCNYTDNERTKEVMRNKIDHWRRKYENPENTPDEENAFANAMQMAQKLFNEYESKVILEDKDEDAGMDGCPLYLFEIPEKQKPMHVRLSHGDLSKT